MKLILKDAILVIIATLLMLAFATLLPPFLARAHADDTLLPAAIAPVIQATGFCADPDELVQAAYSGSMSGIKELAEKGRCLLLNAPIPMHIVGVTSVILNISGDPFIIIKGVVDGYPKAVYACVDGEKMINYIYALVRGVEA